MNITLFGATGALGRECLQQALDQGHQITVLVRNANKLPAEIRQQLTIIEGNALDVKDVERVITEDCDAVLFAIGVDKKSPGNLCTDITRHILAGIGDRPFIWCGGGSTFLKQDQLGLGAQCVRKIAEVFMPLRHYDKERQYRLLMQHPQVNWYGVRPLQMKQGPKLANYRTGYHRFSGLSKISFADCAHAMLNMLASDRWLRQAPIVQY